MKKALCFFFAIMFVCCVMVQGKNERFSIEQFLNNITNFQNMPTIDDIVEVWNSDYYLENGISALTDSGRCYLVEPLYMLDADGNPVVTSAGYYIDDCPVAVDAYGNDISSDYPNWTIHYSYNFVDAYGRIDGTPKPFRLSNGDLYYGKIPFILNARTYYESYEGDNEILEFFDNIKAFFKRVGNVFGLVVDMISSVFRNLKYLLPWNNTVPKGA